MKLVNILVMILSLIGIMSMPALSIGIGRTCPCDQSNPAEVYCVQHGGCPKEGNCYFPDGTYCELQSFYQGTCPSKEYYEQMLWEAEAYRFLYGDEGSYIPGYRPYYNPDYNPYYYPYYPPVLNQQISDRLNVEPFWADPLGPL
ncbi:MAG: DUF333 domain-containing protein [Methanotrichaceae archaeon]|nr:DUF333 domain-containing protein [Methanotrichaceae archaeon]